MATDPIRTILAGAFRPTGYGAAFACPIKHVAIEPSLAGQEADLLHAVGLSGSLALVADPRTFEALGRRICRALPAARAIVLEAPKADEAAAVDLMDRTRHASALIAVGSGTLNDLCKYVSHRRGQAYAVFATAPSMNGYTTTTASLTRRGEKLSLPASPPVGAFFDLEILARAPLRMIRAGIGDSLCRSTAQVDWLLSHHLLGTPYMAAPFAIQADDEEALLARTGELLRGDLDAMRALVRLLVLGGLGMLIAGGSQPGSQGEHLISHYIDMFHRPHPGTLHGEQVGVATWTMAGLQRNILTLEEAPVLRPTVVDSSLMAKRYGPLAASCRRALAAKALSTARAGAMNERLRQRWPSLRADLVAATLPVDRLAAAFAAAGVASDPAAHGIDCAAYRQAVRHARDLRDRYTMLDFAADSARLDSFIDQAGSIRNGR